VNPPGKISGMSFHQKATAARGGVTTAVGGEGGRSSKRSYTTGVRLGTHPSIKKGQRKLGVVAHRKGNSTVARQRRNGAPVVGERGDRPGELLLTEGIPVDLHKRVGNGWSELSRAAVKKGKQGMVAARFTGDSRWLQHRA
jgi:hypothetical protein